MRTADGSRPERTAKIDGARYVLKGIGEVHEQARQLNEAHGITFHYADSSRDECYWNIPAKTRSATDSQIEKWQELAGYRDGRAWTEENGKKHYVDKPDLLWIRTDLAEPVRSPSQN
jgi:hypothetical protein